MLSPPPKINGGHCQPRKNCWCRPPPAPPAMVGMARTTTEQPVLQQRSQDPALLLRAAWKSPLKSRALPLLTLPLLPFHFPPPHHNACHTSQTAHPSAQGKKCQCSLWQRPEAGTPQPPGRHGKQGPVQLCHTDPGENLPQMRILCKLRVDNSDNCIG